MPPETRNDEGISKAAKWKIVVGFVLGTTFAPTPVFSDPFDDGNLVFNALFVVISGLSLWLIYSGAKEARPAVRKCLERRKNKLDHYRRRCLSVPL